MDAATQAARIFEPYFTTRAGTGAAWGSSPRAGRWWRLAGSAARAQQRRGTAAPSRYSLPLAEQAARSRRAIPPSPDPEGQQAGQAELAAR
jgi:hypothetical protein